MSVYKSISTFNFEEVEKLYQKLASLEWETLFVRLEIPDLPEKIQSFLEPSFLTIKQ